AVNSILKIWSGSVADRAARKRPLVFLGYGISSIARPLIAAATNWLQVFTVRVVDRVGKGIRGAPRDAMLATWTTPTTRGEVYGFHRAMDHAGAIVGPTLASAFLVVYPDRYRTLFALTIIPGAIAVGLIFFVEEPADARQASEQDTMRTKRSPLPRGLQSFMAVLTLFTLGNSTDAFLLLKLTDVAGSPKAIPLLWAALHVVKASSSIVGGGWSDRVGRRSVIALG